MSTSDREREEVACDVCGDPIREGELRQWVLGSEPERFKHFGCGATSDRVDPMAALEPGTFVPAYWGKLVRHGWVITERGCHEWTGPKDRQGYGRTPYGGRSPRVHRLRYLLEVGPVPDGLILDHFACDNPTCCNPLHLRPVTVQENTLRGCGVAARQARQTHCKYGHEFSVENTTIRKSGRRECRTCRRLVLRQQYARRKERGLEPRKHKSRARALPDARGREEGE